MKSYGVELRLTGEIIVRIVVDAKNEEDAEEVAMKELGLPLSLYINEDTTDIDFNGLVFKSINVEDCSDEQEHIRS